MLEDSVPLDESTSAPEEDTSCALDDSIGLLPLDVTDDELEDSLLAVDDTSSAVDD